MRKSKSSLGVSALILLVSGLVCKGLGALFRLPLTNLLGIEGIGVFQLVMSLYAFALVVTCGGVTNSLSKLISTARAMGETAKISTYIRRAVFVSVGIGLLIGTLFLILRNYISSLQGIDASYSYMLFVLLLPLGAGLATLRGLFQGYENMVPTAVSQVVEQVFKFVFGLVFAFYYSKISMSHGVFGAFLGIVLSEVVALASLFVFYMRKGKKEQKENDLRRVRFARKEFDKANFPLMFSASILPLVNAFDGLVIIPRLLLAGFSTGTATKLFGLQTGVVGAILNFPLIISMAVTTTLLPNISFLISKGLGGKKVIERGLKMLLYLILPTTFGMVAISKQVFVFFYNNMTGAILDAAFNLMLYGGFSIVFTALMQYLIMLLQANGQFRFILCVTALGGVFKAMISFFLSSVASVNIYALVLGNLVLNATVCILALWRIKKIVEFSLPAWDVFLLIFSTIAMFLTVYTFINCNYFHAIVNLILAMILGVGVYLVLTIPFGHKFFKKEKLRQKV
ncbi:MAG: oligosaccharide flippase family protein [Clostridia bacterium]|nr:oligosaccharide flippase family protein [Clostridia bacterium]